MLPDGWENYTFSFVLFLQDCFSNSGSVYGSIQILGLFVLGSVKKAKDNLIGITLNLQIALGSLAILTILIFPIQKHGISSFL